MGAVLQGVVVLVFPVSYALLPSVLMLSYRFAKTIFATFGLVKNSQMDGVIAGKFSALLPDRNGAFSGKAADQDVALILLAGRSNQYVYALRLLPELPSLTFSRTPQSDGHIRPRLQRVGGLHAKNAGTACKQCG